jgi:hypothetical protein
MINPTSDHPQVAAWLEHVRVLTMDIGPRPPTGDGERKGAEYVKREFERIGLQPARETFYSARSIFLPHVFGALLILLAFIIFPFGGKGTAGLAATLCLLVIVNELLELGFKDNLFRWIMPKGESQNVFAVIPSSAEHRQDLILVGHLDTQRTPIFFRSPNWVKIYDRFTTVLFVAYLLQTALYLLSIFIHWDWVWFATIPTAICTIILLIFLIEADLSPFTAGANDNATAVGLVLTLAEIFNDRPLQYTRLFTVCTGCEEVQHYGMIDWYRRHRTELKNPKALVFEMLGVEGPAWLTQEGIIVPFKSNPELVAMLERLSADHLEWSAYPTKISGGNTEMADAVRAKVPAITLFGMSREGVAPYWHQVGDTFDKMRPEIMESTWDLTRAFIEEIDKSKSVNQTN